MINNLLCECCYTCDTPDIEVDTVDYKEVDGEVAFTNQTITCSHAPMCYKARMERGGEND